LEIRDEDGLVCYKVVCKGFELSYSNAQKINFKTMKELVFTKNGLNEFFNGKRPLELERDSIEGAKRLTFNSSIHNNELVPKETQVQKNLSGDYTKACIHPEDPRFIIPFSEKTKLVPPPGSFLSNRSIHYE
jgi:hypothetical protein